MKKAVKSRPVWICPNCKYSTVWMRGDAFLFRDGLKCKLCNATMKVDRGTK